MKFIIIATSFHASSLLLETYPAYLSKNNKLTRKISYYLGALGLSDSCFNSDISASEGDVIIVFDEFSSRPFLRWVEKRYPQQRKIFWYWNSVSFSVPPQIVPDSFEIWSYSTFDCQKYGFSFNTQFFPSPIDHFQNIKNQIFDLVFVGKDKGRKKEILKTMKRCEGLGLKCLTYLVRNREFLPKTKYAKPALNEKEFLKIQSSGNAILDICVSPYSGLSLRPLEACASGQKVLSNCLELKKSALFSYGNMGIIQEMNDDQILDFINKKTNPIPSTVLDYYSLESWLSRFAKK
jgi:hypothetical protein